VAESDHQIQSQIDYLPSLDLSTNQAKQQSSTLHIGTHWVDIFEWIVIHINIQIQTINRPC
jgi:hypothetical protein